MNILAIGAHPDDLEISCGGTLIRYVKEGHKVSMCVVSGGDMGHAIIKPDELVKIRRKESENAAKVIGADFYNLGSTDGHIESGDKEVRSQLIEIMRQTKPDIIIAHNPDAVDSHVCWQFTVDNRLRDYYWGIYGDEQAAVDGYNARLFVKYN